MLYTRKGDDGTSSLWGTVKRQPKHAPVFEALGSLDELVSLLGVVKTRRDLEVYSIGKKKLYDVIEEVQQHLFTIQAELAGAQKKLGEEKVGWLEEHITEIEQELPPIKSFFLPGGAECSALLDYARTLARRTERRIIELNATATVSVTVKQYINRLSSLLYALARVTNKHKGKQETPPTYT